MSVIKGAHDSSEDEINKLIQQGKAETILNLTAGAQRNVAFSAKLSSQQC